MEQRLGSQLLQIADEAGLKVTRNGDKLKIRGPKSADDVAKNLIENKEEVMAALESRPLAPVETEKLRARLCKGIDWFVAVDSKMYDKDGNPTSDNPRNHGSEMEKKMMGQTLKWLELERMLRNLYEYKGCIFTEGSCPKESPVRCSHCG